MPPKAKAVPQPKAAPFKELEKVLFTDKDTLLDPAFSMLSVSGNPGRVIVVISGDQLGSGDQAGSGEQAHDQGHGQELLLHFLEGLCDRVTLPDEIVIYHRGVLILTQDHEARTILSRLCSQDVEIKACRESLDFYKIEPAVSKIQPALMSEITRDLLKADKVIHP